MLHEYIVRQAVEELLEYSKEHQRKFLESVELQVTLKEYDPCRDKRFSGTVVLPYECRPNLRVCVYGNGDHINQAKDEVIPVFTIEDLRLFNKNKKVIRNHNKKYQCFLASESIIRQIPRVLGPCLGKVGKFPTIISENENIVDKIDQLKKTVRFQMKKVLNLNVTVGSVSLPAFQLEDNIIVAIHFLISLLEDKKGWGNIKKLYIKSTMGKSFCIYKDKP